MQDGRPGQTAIAISRLCLAALTLWLVAGPFAAFAAGSGESITLRLPPGQAAGALYLRPGGPHALATATLDFEAFDATGAGERLFVAAGDDGLVVLALQAEGPPRETARLALDGPATKLRIAGDVAWLIGPLGLTSVDIGVPDEPAVIAYYPTPSMPVDFALGEGLAWLLLPREILTFDVSMPGFPILVGRSGLQFSARALEVRHNRIYLAAGAAGLISFDRRQPPPRAAGYRPGGAVNDLALADDRIVIATDDGITLVEGAGVAGLRWLGSFRTAQPVERVAVAGERATILTADRRLWLLDIANPDAIRIEALLARDCCEAWQHHDRHAFVLSGDTLSIIDAGVPAPQLGNEGLAFGQGVNLGGQRRVFIDGDIAYVADWFAGLHLYAIDDPARPRLLASLNTDGSAKGVVVRDGIAFVADDDHGLQVVDVRDPREPRQIANLLLPGLAYTPVLDGGLLWLASHYGGVLAIDVKDPATPRLVAHYEIPGRTWSLRVRDGIAYVAADEAGLLIIDIADPARARMLGSYAPGARAEDIVIDGNVAFIAFFDDGVHAVDIADPAQPRPLAQLTTPGNARGLDRVGDRLYVADWRAGVLIVDVGDPRRPRIAGHYDTDGAAWGVQANGTSVFVADWWGGITLLSIEDAERPQAIGHYPPRTPVAAVATRDRFAFVLHEDSGLQVFDIDNALNPTWATGFDLPGARAMVIDDRYAAVLTRSDELVLVDLVDPWRPRIRDRQPAGRDALTVRAAGARWMIIGSAGITLVDPHNGESRRIAIAGTVRDATSINGRLLVATAAGLRDVHGGDPAALSSLNSADISRVVADDDRVVIHVEDEGLRVLAPSLSEVARIALDNGVNDLLLDGDTLVVATTAPGVLVFDITDPAQPRLVSSIATMGTVGGLHLHDGTLYLSGQPQLLALALSAPARIANDAMDRIVLQLPDGLAPGAWDLAVAEAPLPGPVLRHSVVEIAPLRFGRPQLSAEEFEALRLEHLQQPR